MDLATLAPSLLQSNERDQLHVSTKILLNHAVQQRPRPDAGGYSRPAWPLTEPRVPLSCLLARLLTGRKKLRFSHGHLHTLRKSLNASKVLRKKTHICPIKLHLQIPQKQ